MKTEYKNITIYRKGKETIRTRIPKQYVEMELVAYWVDVICPEDCNGWYDYKVEE